MPHGLRADARATLGAFAALNSDQLAAALPGQLIDDLFWFPLLLDYFRGKTMLVRCCFGFLQSSAGG